MAVGSEEYVIMRSDNYRYFLLSIVIAVGIVAVVLTFIMMIGTRKVFGVELGVLGWFVRLGIILLVVLAAYIMNYEFKNRQYIIDDKRLFITQLRFWWQKNKQIIAIEPSTIKAVSLKQGYLEKMMQSGTIVIELDTRNARELVRLEHIDDPTQVLRELEEYLKQGSK